MGKAPIGENPLKRTQKNIQEKIGEFLGCPVHFTKPTAHRMSREELVSRADSMMVLVKMAVTGEEEGEAFLLVSLEGAIFLGGTLIMLPAKELENRAANEEFSEEEADAFGEIVNLVAGVLTADSNEHFPKKLHFRKLDLQLIDPLGEEEAAVQALPEQEFFIHSCQMRLERRELGPMHIVLPARMLALETQSPQPAPVPEAEPQLRPEPPPSSPPEEKADTPSRALVISAEPEAGRPFAEALAESGLEARCVDFEENIRELLRAGGVTGVFLVMEEVNEQGLSIVIRIRAATEKRLPLVVAGPRWTRETVLQAVKYGANDILVTPAESRIIREKIDRLLRDGPPESREGSAA